MVFRPGGGTEYLPLNALNYKQEQQVVTVAFNTTDRYEAFPWIKETTLTIGDKTILLTKDIGSISEDITIPSNPRYFIINIPAVPYVNSPDMCLVAIVTDADPQEELYTIARFSNYNEISIETPREWYGKKILTMYIHF